MGVIKFDDGAYAMVRADGAMYVSIETHDVCGDDTLCLLTRDKAQALRDELDIAIAALPPTEKSKPQKPRRRR
jgi:hypothetical protein